MSTVKRGQHAIQIIGIKVKWKEHTTVFQCVSALTHMLKEIKLQSVTVLSLVSV